MVITNAEIPESISMLGRIQCFIVRQCLCRNGLWRYLFMTHKKGISSVQLSKDIGVTQKTAWAMLHRIRKCFGERNKMLTLEGIVEIDETFVGGKDKRVKHCKGRSFKDKVPVFGMLQRKGNVVARVVKNTTAKTLRAEIYKTIKENSHIAMNGTTEFYPINIDIHTLVIVMGVYRIGEVSTNAIEGFWSILKRGIIGDYHKVSKKTSGKIRG